MQLTIKKEIEETVDIELPAYYKMGGMLHKIINEGDYIGVSSGTIADKLTENRIEIMKGYDRTVRMILQSGDKINEAAFNNQYQNALSEITKQSFLGSGISTPALDEDMRNTLWEEGCEDDDYSYLMREKEWNDAYQQTEQQ